MAISFLDKTGLTSLWAKIKATFALKSEIPDSTSDLTNDSGFIDSARFDITVTSSYDSATDTTTYTADKTYQQITTAITEGKIPYVAYSGELYKYLGIYDGMISFGCDGLSSLSDGQGAIISISLAYTGFSVDSTNTWEWYADSTVIASKTSQLTNDSGFITSANIPQSDWNQNNSSANDYVKNRVCYSGDPVYTILFEYTESLSDNNQIFGTWQTQEPLTFADNDPYILSFDGDTYTGTIFSDSSYGWVAGNFHIPNSDAEDTEEPFCIIFGPNDDFVSGASGFFSVNLAERYTGTIDLEFQVGESTVHKLDDKYLNGSLIKRGTGAYSVILNGEFNELTASGDNSVAEGYYSTASGYSSHAEGSSTASGRASHSEGSSTASGEYGHSEGFDSTASGNYSHSENYETFASANYSHAEGYQTKSSGLYGHSEGYRNVASGVSSHSEGGADTRVDNARPMLQLTGDANATTYNIFINTTDAPSLVGYALNTADNYIVSETVVDGAIKTITLTKTLSTGSVGNAQKWYIVSKNEAKGLSSHAEGAYTIADGYFSHSENMWTHATGSASHAEGNINSVTGDYGHVEGVGNIANHRSQHVFGEYNVADNSAAASTSRGNYVEIIGNGSKGSRSNARTLDWNGNEVLAGKLTVGAAPTANMDVATKQYVDTAVAGSGGGGQTVVETNPTLETEWVDVYSDWAAGYYYDPDNNYAYTQIPSTETTWSETQTYISTSCTPYTNLIPVVPGEEWRYQNMPVYFDSKSAIVPSIIIFDSNKAEIDQHTRTFQDEWTEFTIPSGGAWMAVLYANSQTYYLQKKVAKRLNQKELVDTINADYRAYQLTVPPTPNTLTKAYICLGTDDLRAWETKNLHTLFTSHNIPYYMATIPDNIKACVTNDPYKTNLDYMRLCVAAGGEIICHSGPVITDQNKTDFDSMYTYFCKNKEQIEHYGFKVRGIFKAGGEDAVYGEADPVIDAWAMHYYEYGDDFTTAFPYLNSRTMLEDWADYSALTVAIQNAVQNHTPFIGVAHYYNASVETAISTILSALQGYTEGTDYEFVTPSQLYDIMMPTARPTGGGGSAVTYSLSMSSNVITLTGSNGSTSSVTLPVYTGGVSS